MVMDPNDEGPQEEEAVDPGVEAQGRISVILGLPPAKEDRKSEEKTPSDLLEEVAMEYLLERMNSIKTSIADMERDLGMVSNAIRRKRRAENP